ncbi:isopentenyl phosphate kinase family protein [Calothrix anomala FACHB-343]|uniref:Isopentenyl phosphate kinase n=3 Tax=Calotrichaceae TaxID=2661849 RepID=A0ABR8AD64_9CYAN|nr:isopentenyl phosphate kinase family protein [Calothrix parietina FACHB-288]MBD2225997.1 isopentenyl phosphate kinase family protein [Calothrix anomala FACHB-343]
MELALIKLGGSLITDKDRPYTAKPEIIQQLAGEVSAIALQNPHLKLIIGNGAGSFGHQSAKKYNTINGISTDVDKFGFCLVHQDAIDLNRLIAKAFLQAGLPVISLPPVTMGVTENKKPIKFNYSIIENTLAAGLIPLVFGDVVLDKIIGGTILSTDTVLAELAKHFHIKENLRVQLINVGNYPGVYDQYGQVISEITSANYPHIKNFLGESKSVDVTGGMLRKVKEFLAIADLGIDCWIIDGAVPGNLTNAVLGKSALGTLIKA